MKILNYNQTLTCKRPQPHKFHIGEAFRVVGLYRKEIPENRSKLTYQIESKESGLTLEMTDRGVFRAFTIIIEKPKEVEPKIVYKVVYRDLEPERELSTWEKMSNEEQIQMQQRAARAMAY